MRLNKVKINKLLHSNSFLTVSLTRSPQQKADYNLQWVQQHIKSHQTQHVRWVNSWNSQWPLKNKNVFFSLKGVLGKIWLCRGAIDCTCAITSTIRKLSDIRQPWGSPFHHCPDNLWHNVGNYTCIPNDPVLSRDCFTGSHCSPHAVHPMGTEHSPEGLDDYTIYHATARGELPLNGKSSKTNRNRNELLETTREIWQLNR